MKTTETSWDEQVHEHKIVGRIGHFFQEHQVGTLLHRCGIKKGRGVSPMIVLHALFGLSFFGDNIFRSLVLKASQPFGKDVAYDFLRCETFNWRRFLLLIASKIAAFIDSLTGTHREQVLIIDDSTIERPRSKKVELLSRVYDHSEGKFIKGFRMLTLGWSDGSSFLPLDFALLSSREDKNRYQDITKNVDKRSCGYKRRLESLTKSTDLLEPMVRRALSRSIRAKYILMDSWFAMPKTISKLHVHLPVICMVKNTPKIHYGFAGIPLPLKAIYALLHKRPGKAKILTSTLVTLKGGLSAKLVFVRDRRNSDWLALLSTDTTLPEEEIVRIYGKRWEIEVFFKMSKQHLNLESGVQARDFDSLIAHTTIVMMRHLFLSLVQRRHDDPRTLGVLFHACCEEVKDLTFFQSLKRILALLADQLQRTGRFSQRSCTMIIETAFKCAIDFMKPKGLFCQRAQRVTC